MILLLTSKIYFYFSDDQSLPQKKQKANVEEAVKQKVKPEEQIVMLELEVKTLKTEYDSKSKRAKVEV